MSLVELQNDFRAWLTDESDAAALRIGERARPGLLVYQNNYRAQLVACLSEAFERVRLWLGDNAFLEAVASHIYRTPPSAWTLDAYSKDFPETLLALYPDDPEVFELAWLDHALADVFVGFDPDSQMPEDLAAVDWDNAILHLTRAMQIGFMTTNAAAIWSALSAGGMPPAAQNLSTPAALLVWRQDFTSCFRTLDRFEKQAIDYVQAGNNFGGLCGTLIEAVGEIDGVAHSSRILGQWLNDGLLIGISYYA